MKKYLLGTLALVAIAAVPAAYSYAAMFAYVNQGGEVRSIEAADANSALMLAPDIHANSGVILLDSSDDDDLVGDEIPVN